MKTTKSSSNTRRSLRNAPNGTKTDAPRSVKAADEAKSSAKVKSKVAKGSPKPSPTKAVTPVSKRKREEEEKAEESSGDTASQESEEVNKPLSSEELDETTAKPKTKRSKKKKDNRQAEEVKWRALDVFDEDKGSDESRKKVGASKGGDRRKQSLVERDIPCAVMVQSVVRGLTHREDDSDCEVLDGANSGEGAKKSRQNFGPFDVHVDADDVQSEAGSNFCEIIEEGSSSLDFKKLHALARRVHLPSTLWACHTDPMSHFVSFSRFNPDFSESSSHLVDRAVVFKGSMRPIVFCYGQTTTLPEEINSFETLTDVSHALQHLNASMLP